MIKEWILQNAFLEFSIAWLATACGLAVAGERLTRCMRRASDRHLSSTVVLVGLVCLPVCLALSRGWSSPLLQIRLPTLSALSTPQSQEEFSDSFLAGSPAVASLPVDAVGSLPSESTVVARQGAGNEANASSVSPPMSERSGYFFGLVVRIAIVVWSVGVLVGLGRILLDWLQLRRLVLSLPKAADPRLVRMVSKCQEELELSKIEVRMAGTGGPYSSSVPHAAVIIPESIMYELSDQELQCLLVHELAHLQRHDPLWRICGRCVSSIYWFLPAVYSLCRQQASAAEELCDAAVLRVADGLAYSQALLRIARTLIGRTPTLAIGALSVSREESLEQRIKRLLSSDRECLNPPTQFRTKLAAFSIVFMSCTLVSFCGLGLGKNSATAIAKEVPVTTVDSTAVIIRVTGTLVNPQDKPLSGAVVIAHPEGDYSDKQGSTRMATTDNEGAFVFELPNEVVVGNWQFWAYKPGYSVRCVIAKPERDKNLPMSLAAESPLELRLLLADGSPAAGVRVIPHMTDIPRGEHIGDIGMGRVGTIPQGIQKWTTRTTNEDGKVVIVGFQEGLTRKIWTDGPETGVQWVQLPGGIERFEFPLKPVGEVLGKISLPEGIDPSKLQLSFLSGSRTNDARTGYANTSIDAEGKFRVEKMAEGDLSLRIAGWPEGSIFRPFVSEELNVAANGQLNVKVQSKEGVRLIGELITADSKVPIENCKLFCELPQEIAQFVCIVEIATTKKDGVFEIWCPRDAKKLWIYEMPLADYRRTRQTPILLPETLLSEARQQVKLDRIEVEPLTHVQGKIMDAQGAPFIPEAVGIAEEAGHERQVIQHTKVAKDGTFQLRTEYINAAGEFVEQHGVRMRWMAYSPNQEDQPSWPLDIVSRNPLVLRASAPNKP